MTTILVSCGEYDTEEGKKLCNLDKKVDEIGGFPFSIFITTKRVHNLPEKKEEYIVLKMEPELQELFDDFTGRIKVEYLHTYRCVCLSKMEVRIEDVDTESIKPISSEEDFGYLVRYANENINELKKKLKIYEDLLKNVESKKQ